MLSLSKNEFNVIGFLIRNFSKRFTIRNIASELRISAAGAHAVLKKLEQGNIVRAERLGTGLFYEINLDNKVAQHLTAIVLLEYFKLKEINIKEIEKESKAAIFDGKQLFIITNNAEHVKDICYKSLREIEVICKTEEEFIEALKDKERETLEILENSNVLFGEDLVVGLIKKVTR